MTTVTRGGTASGWPLLAALRIADLDFRGQLHQASDRGESPFLGYLEGRRVLRAGHIRVLSLRVRQGSVHLVDAGSERHHEREVDRRLLALVLPPERNSLERRIRREDLQTGSLALQCNAQDAVLHGLVVAQAHPYCQGRARGQRVGRLPALVEQFEAEDLGPSHDPAVVRGPEALGLGRRVTLFFVLYLVVQLLVHLAGAGVLHLLRPRQHLLVVVDYLLGAAGGYQPSLVEQHGLRAESLYHPHAVGDEKDRGPGVLEVVHPLDRLLLECRVACGEGLVYDKDIRLDVDRDGEAKATAHTARIGLDRLVHELPDVSESLDVVEALHHLIVLYAKDKAAQHGVLTPRKERVEPRPDTEDRRQSTPDLDLTRRRPQNARDYAHKRTLASPVAANDAQGGAWFHIQVDVLQRPELVASFGLAEAQDLPQPRGPARGDPVLLAYSPEGDGRRHRWSANPGFILTNRAKPARNRAKENRAK